MAGVDGGLDHEEFRPEAGEATAGGEREGRDEEEDPQERQAFIEPTDFLELEGAAGPVDDACDQEEVAFTMMWWIT